LGHGGSGIGISKSKLTSNAQFSFLVIRIAPDGVCKAGHVPPARTGLAVTETKPAVMSGQNGGASNGGQVGAPQSKIGGGSGGILQSSINLKSTTGTNGTSQFVKSASGILTAGANSWR
jgi:hypothetical protein